MSGQLGNKILTFFNNSVSAIVDCFSADAAPNQFAKERLQEIEANEAMTNPEAQIKHAATFALFMYEQENMWPSELINIADKSNLPKAKKALEDLVEKLDADTTAKQIDKLRIMLSAPDKPETQSPYM